MARSASPSSPRSGRALPAKPGRRWLLLVHVLPPTPSNLRVRTWRRLLTLGAIAVKQSVYVLPDSPGAREDFEWLRTEIVDAGGEASVFAGDAVGDWSDDALVEAFRAARQEAYAEIARDLQQALKRPARDRRAPGRASDATRTLEAFRRRVADLERIDFFGSPGRDRVAGLMAELEGRTAPVAPPSGRRAPAAVDRTAYRGRRWVTRPRPGVDRMASAWLIRRFIDPSATFSFVADARTVPAGVIAFDMFGVELTHHGSSCTFETLVDRFGLRDPALDRIAAIVHTLDLGDGTPAPDAPTVGLLIDGLQQAHEDDAVLLEQGTRLFEALYRSFSRAVRGAASHAGGRRAARMGPTRSR